MISENCFFVKIIVGTLLRQAARSAMKTLPARLVVPGHVVPLLTELSKSEVFLSTSLCVLSQINNLIPLILFFVIL